MKKSARSKGSAKARGTLRALRASETTMRFPIGPRNAYALYSIQHGRAGWKSLSEGEKAHWQSLAEKDRERYQEELILYTKSMKKV